MAEVVQPAPPGSARVQVRICGTREECEHASSALRASGSGWRVVEVSQWYPNRRTRDLGRVYVQAVPPVVVER